MDVQERRHTPEQKIRFLVLAATARMSGNTAPDYSAMSGDDIDSAYGQLVENDEHWDGKSEVRCGGVATGLKCEWSRHYESDAVAAQLPDGSWVGWTYWYGGGKHGEPEAVDWIHGSYDLTCAEEEKVVTVRTFARVAEEVPA